MNNYKFTEYKPIKKKKNKLPIIIIIIIIICAVGYYAYVQFSPQINQFLNSKQGANSTTYINKTQTLEVEAEDQMTKAIEKVYDAVMCIEVYDKNGSLSSTGTGFVYKKGSKYGYVVTNSHVVNGGSSIKGLLSNNKAIDLTLISSDTVLDLAVLKMSEKDVLKVATLGSSEPMKLGNTVIAIGAPMGSTYAGTVTRGILAGKDRMVGTSTTNSTSADYIVKVIQTDAAINPGNSGGPLVNLAGEVIGITSLKLVDTNIEGMGFAIPMEDVIKYIQKLENNQEILRPVFGVNLFDITYKDYLSMYYNINIDSSIKSGVIVQSVEANYPAALAGIKKGDVITKINGINIDTVADFRYNLYKYDVGEKVIITYIRGKTTKTAEATLSTSK